MQQQQEAQQRELQQQQEAQQRQDDARILNEMEQRRRDDEAAMKWRAEQQLKEQQLHNQQLQQLHIDSQPSQMDGVFEYPASRTMTENERARHRTPKRKDRATTGTTKPAPVSSLQAAVASAAESVVSAAAAAAVEQNDVLMLGREEVWTVQPLPPEGEDEF